MAIPAENLTFQYKLSITLVRLTLKNFKGLKDFTLEPNGRPISVFGDNSTGKTTLYDAFLWLLFDKDSSNRKSFSVKTLDAKGNPLHGLEHTVEAVLNVNGNPLVLKKTLVEKWTKKRGEASRKLTGHETLYWIDDVPVKAGEYQQRINALVSEDLFRLITNPMYFNTFLSWQDRRKLLLEMAGDVSDTDVIASNKALARLTDILKGKTTDDYKKILHERIRKLNDEIAKIPVRIDELNSTLAGDDIDYIAVETEIARRKTELADIEKQMLSASSIVEEFRAKQKRLDKLYSDLGMKKAELEREANAGYNALAEESRRLKSTLAETENEISILESRFKMTSDEKQSIETKMIELREEWKEVNDKTFTEPDPGSLTCPACGQGLPANQKEAMIVAARDNFLAVKKSRLTQITKEGKALKEKAEGMQDKLATMEQSISEKMATTINLEAQIEEITAKLTAERPTVDVESHPEYQAIKQQIEQMEADFQAPSQDAASELLAQKQAITQEIERLNGILNNRGVRERTLARIEELAEQERTLAQQINELEGHRYLIEQFIVTKVNLLESTINQRFRTVTFKLFDVQINEGIKECCEALINGVPFADANNGAKINAGLDIIDTLTKHYGVSAPVFVDNREAVTRLLPIQSQVISLIVSEADKTLRVEG